MVDYYKPNINKHNIRSLPNYIGIYVLLCRDEMNKTKIFENPLKQSRRR